MSLTSERVPRSLDSPKQPAPRKSLAASTVGQLLEWFEWSAYAVFAPFIAQVMFNPANPVSALLSTLAVFAVGFLVRPLGGVVFGAIADRRSPRASVDGHCGESSRWSTNRSGRRLLALGRECQ